MLNNLCKFTLFLRDMEGNQKEITFLKLFCQKNMDNPIYFAICGELKTNKYE